MEIQSVHISIPKPCHEDWNKMTPNEKGSFCSKCSKTVVDFTKKTVNEITAILESSGKKVCGRFMNEQLDQAYSISSLHTSVSVLTKQKSFSNAFVVVLFIVFGTTLFSCSSHPEETVGKVQTDSIESNIEPDSLTQSDDSKILNDTSINKQQQKDKINSQKDCKSTIDNKEEHMIQGSVILKPGLNNVKDSAKIDSAGVLPKVGELKIYRGHDQ